MLPHALLFLLAVALVTALFAVARMFGKFPALILGSLALAGIAGFAFSALALS